MTNSSFSPYLKELLVYVGQEENYSGAVDLTEKMLRFKTNSMQIQRLVLEYGAAAEDLLSKETPCVEITETERIYAMLDGGMLLTRPSDWQEAKIGRVFKEGAIHKMSEQRKEIRQSEYTAHLGNHRAFAEKMRLLVDKYEHLADRLVFINDGARWIWNWVEAEYPNAIQILDFFHAMEHIGTFAKIYFKPKEVYLKWIEKMGHILKNQGIDKVIQIVQDLEKKTQTVENERIKLLQYCQNNYHRMHYPQFIEEGLLIGSGAIEAAHRTISQKRLKQSGQRWSKKGAQNVLNLRVLNKSNRWNEFQNLLRAA